MRVFGRLVEQLGGGPDVDTHLVGDLSLRRDCLLELFRREGIGLQQTQHAQFVSVGVDVEFGEQPGQRQLVGHDIADLVAGKLLEQGEGTDHEAEQRQEDAGEEKDLLADRHRKSRTDEAARGTAPLPTMLCRQIPILRCFQTPRASEVMALLLVFPAFEASGGSQYPSDCSCHDDASMLQKPTAIRHP